MDYLPIFFKLNEIKCLIVGGGDIAKRKAATLLKAGGIVTVIAPDICDDLKNSTELQCKLKSFEPSDLEGFNLVVSATSDQELNKTVSIAAKARNILVNVVDSPDLCNFIFPSIVDRSPVITAISSGGASPVLSRLLRMRLETLIPPGYGELAKLAGSFRQRVKDTLSNAGKRRRFWETALQGDIAELVFSGQEKQAIQKLENLLQGYDQTEKTGMVYLVGAGPGDPDLLTLRALRLIQEADVVVYDRLVSQEVMNLVRRDADKIYAGKQQSNHSLPQEQINRLLVDLAKSGKRVVRLKGGDPFIFGRGGEEIETLMEEGIHFQIIPGITAASGCAAYAGIPLTHRDYAQSCTFITGHAKQGGELDWKRWTAPNQTLVIYMGLEEIENICSTLIQNGCAKELPAALIVQGTTQRQKVIIGNLENLAEKVRSSNAKAPTLIIVGEVVKLHDKLKWFQPEN